MNWCGRAEQLLFVRSRITQAFSRGWMLSQAEKMRISDSNSVSKKLGGEIDDRDPRVEPGDADIPEENVDLTLEGREELFQVREHTVNRWPHEGMPCPAGGGSASISSKILISEYLRASSPRMITCKDLL